MWSHFGRCYLCGSIIAAATLLSGGHLHADEPNPSYTNWASHKVGTSVRINRMDVSFGRKNLFEMTQTLTEVGRDKLYVEVKTVTLGRDHKVAPSISKMEIPARIPTAPGLGMAPARSDVKDSEETVKVSDRSYKCKATSYTTTVEDDTVYSKVWECPEMPGFIVKYETKSKGTVSKYEVVEVTEK